MSPKGKGGGSASQHSTVATLYDETFTHKNTVSGADELIDAAALFKGLNLNYGNAKGAEVSSQCKSHAEMKLLACWWTGLKSSKTFGSSVGIELNEFPCSCCHTVLKVLTIKAEKESGPRFNLICIRMPAGTSTAYMGDHAGDAGAMNINPPVTIRYQNGAATYHRHPAPPA